MPTPRADSYSAPSGASLKAGRGGAVATAVLDLIAAAPVNSWVKLNLNTYQSAWSPAELRQGFPYSGGSSPESPDRTLGKWGSAAWDASRGRFIVWGGGHANSGLNEVYLFEAATRRWRLGFNATRMVQVDAYPRFRSVDGNASPVSSHTYCNNNYLPILDRFYTGGGAAFGDGGPLRVWDGDTRLRDSGGFTLDLSLAGQGYVGGASGSNVKYGAYASTDLPGANAWKQRDWALLNPEFLSTGSGGNKMERIESGTAYAQENGHDVLYWTGNGRMWRTEFLDDNPANDIVTRISGPQSGLEYNGQIAYDPVRRILLMPNGRRPDQRLFYFLDRKRPPNLVSGFTSITSMIGQDAPGFVGPNGLSTPCGLAFDRHQDAFVLWGKGRQPWIIRAPAGDPTPSTGWVVEQPLMDAVTAAPPDVLNANDAGVIGKFKYAEDLRCCVCIEDIFNGNVWALKLAGWTDPRN